ncbi:unnamed protein product [Schistosoma curassoni]|uniref:Uncharacterized protein n=1 Tax=Schistosoma curassoni TaxID=6186 RepID=A0A183JP06_9TREM|nr:unnamed protein product [Schistosoma curassoni]
MCNFARYKLGLRGCSMDRWSVFKVIFDQINVKESNLYLFWTIYITI